MLYLETSSFPYLHVTTTFLSLQPYGLGGLSPISRDVFVRWVSGPF